MNLFEFLTKEAENAVMNQTFARVQEELEKQDAIMAEINQNLAELERQIQRMGVYGG